MHATKMLCLALAAACAAARWAAASDENGDRLAALLQGIGLAQPVAPVGGGNWSPAASAVGAERDVDPRSNGRLLEPARDGLAPHALGPEVAVFRQVTAKQKVKVSGVRADVWGRGEMQPPPAVLHVVRRLAQEARGGGPPVPGPVSRRLRAPISASGPPMKALMTSSASGLGVSVRVSARKSSTVQEDSSVFSESVE